MEGPLLVNGIAVVVFLLFIIQFFRLALRGDSKKELFLTLALWALGMAVWLVHNAFFNWGWDVYTYVPLVFALATFLLSVFGLLRLQKEEEPSKFQKEI
ncbi:hypothetical membrane protein [Thermococcus onnurineus NA1]|uniref:Hypothetical membrane protein n=1 Tax=Thermococcus onnurineus (strain NA1) TaxID=523850 RepID=B6YSE8_THEON|nr:hypothetical protein [Thermococcus onnurineus]ACJ15516.1 hypothetical membrane protein [Thermococcus onnurineus NA1]